MGRDCLFVLLFIYSVPICWRSVKLRRPSATSPPTSSAPPPTFSVSPPAFSTFPNASHLGPPVMWTTKTEFAWLNSRIPDHRRAQEAPGQQVQVWLRALANDFIATFPVHTTLHHETVVQVRDSICFHELGLTRSSEAAQLVLLSSEKRCR
jgi:hypothetical protein